MICFLFYRSCDLSGMCNEGEGILSPLDEDFSADSEQNISLSPAPITSDCTRDINSSNNDVEGK